MANVVKHTMHYQEQRRTLFLNLHEKDDHGRHRGQVLYGMRLTPSGSKVVIRPGAISTAYGTKFYWDVINSSDPDINTLDLNDISTVSLNGVSVFDAANNGDRPIVVGIIARVTPTDPSRQPEIESDDALSANGIEFIADVIAYNRATGLPTHNLAPLNPVTMDSSQPGFGDGDYYKTWDLYGGGATVALKAGGLATESLQVSDVLLGYVIIGADSSGVPATTVEGSPAGTWADGVAYVPLDNSWSALIDFLGYDPLLGRVTDRVTGSPLSGSALDQNPTDFVTETGTHSAPLSLAPKFGTSPVFSASNPWGGSWDTYRLPSFMKDGEQLIWQLRRLDYLLRLWMDRTGDQELVNLIQDGAGANLDFQASLDQILTEFTGGTGTNQNVLTWGDGGPNAPDTVNDHPLKSGKVAHSGSTGPGTDLADSHRQAVIALGESVRHILQDLFGFDGVDGGRASMERVTLRQVGKWNRTLYDALKHFDDGPIGRLPSAGVAEDDRPVLVQGVSTAYLNRESMYEAMGKVANRASVTGRNMLRNPKFISGTNISTGNNEFPEWVRDGASSWDRIDVLSPLQVKAADVIMDSGNRAFYQELDSAVGSMMEDGSRMTASTSMEVVTGNVRVKVEGWTDSGMGTKVFEVYSATLPAVSGYRTHNFSFLVDTPSSVGYMRFTVESADGADCRVRIAGTWLGLGTAPENPAFDVNYYEFLLRDGGEDNAMRGNLFLGGNELFMENSPSDIVWDDRPMAVNAPETKPTYSAGLTDPHASDSAGAKELLSYLLQRSSSRLSADSLHNGQFEIGATDGTLSSLASAATLSGWTWTGSLSNTSWAVQSGSYLYEQMVRITTWDDGVALAQVVENTAAATDGDQRFDGHRMWTAAAAFKGVNADVVQLVVIARDSADTEVGRATRSITCNGEDQQVSLSFAWDGSSVEVDKLELQVVNADGAEISQFDLYATWMGAGLAPTDIRKTDSGVYLTRQPKSPLLGDLDSGGFQLKNVADPTDPLDAVNKQTFDTLVANKASINYEHTFYENQPDGSLLDFNQRSNTNHPDSSTRFTAQADAFHTIDVRIITSGYGAGFKFRRSGTTVHTMGTGFTTNTDQSAFSRIESRIDHNIKSPDHDGQYLTAVMFLYAGEYLDMKWFSSNDYSGALSWFRVQQL